MTKVLQTQQLRLGSTGTCDRPCSHFYDSPRHPHLPLFSHNLVLAFCHCYHLRNYFLTFTPLRTAKSVIYWKTSSSSGQLFQYAVLICQTLQSRCCARHPFDETLWHVGAAGLKLWRCLLNKLSSLISNFLLPIFSFYIKPISLSSIFVSHLRTSFSPR